MRKLSLSLLLFLSLLSAAANAQTVLLGRMIVANAGSTGTTLNKLAKLTGAPSTAVRAATTDTGGIVGITVAGAGTTGNATIQMMGIVACIFDGATTAGDYAQISASTAGDCHDTGATYPTSGQVLGRVLSTNGGGGTYVMNLFPAEISATAGSGGSVASVFSRTGAVVAGTNDYTCGQVTNCAVVTCQPGLGDGLNAIPAGTYLMSECLNEFGVTVTITAIKCLTDNNGSSTLNATNDAGSGLLTGAVTCTDAFASGTQSGTTTLASGKFVKFTFVADGTSKQTTFVVTATRP